MKQLALLIFLSFTFSTFSQHQDKVDFIHADVYVKPIPSEKKIIGTVAYKFNVLSDVDSVFLDAKNMKFGYVSLDDNVAEYDHTDKIIVFRKKFKANDTHTIGIGFEVTPKQTVYFLGWDDSEQTVAGSKQVWTQGQGKYTSHWLPSFDAMEEKVEFDLTIAAALDMTVIANGQNLLTSKKKDKAFFEWNYDMQEPMSSYLLAFAIGRYDKQTLTSKSGISLENYYYPKDSLKVEPTYRYTREIFDFLEDEIGVRYPWQNYKQLPVRDFLYAGMENTTTTIFSDSYVIDSTAFVDKNYVNINAHELAHQWFGNLVTEKNGKHHWLHEGFATYYAYLAEQHVFGDDHFYWKLYEKLNQLNDVVVKGEGQSLLDPKANSLTFYEKGAWALVMLRNEVGDKAFKKGIKNYLKKYKFNNARVDDFLKEMEKASRKNLSNFRQVWLINKDFPFEKAKIILAEKSPSIQLLFDMEAAFKVAQSDDVDYKKYWDASNSIHLKKYILSNFRPSLPDEIYKRAFESDTIPIRQALLSGRDLPKFMDKEKLESLLKDESYITQENALFALWQAYPQESTKYLDATRDVVGLPNKNVRLLWLTLAMLSENYNGIRTKDYFDALGSYTKPEYSTEIRQSAFFYLKEAFGLNEQSLTNLVKATNHHSWQFKKFARNLLDELLVDSDYKARLEKLATELKTEETRYLKSKL